MSRTVPPIPPPLGTSSGSMGNPNVNKVDTMPTTNDPINTTTTTNVSQSVVDENLPQLLDSRGGSHVTNDEEFVSSEDEGTTNIRELMEITEDEPSVEKADARSGQWVDITMKKVTSLTSESECEDLGILKEETQKGLTSLNYNGITFTMVAYVNGLKHNLINISQLCDANFKVLFKKTQGTIFNLNDEVVLMLPEKEMVYIH
ncbi:hypothetical protein Tco_0355198 [Tanacetum coccineum]